MSIEIIKRIVVAIESKNKDYISVEYVPFSIVKRKNTFHFETKWELQKCSLCNKISFPEEKIANLYAYYMALKYNKSLRPYYSNCNFVYHLTSN